MQLEDLRNAASIEDAAPIDRSIRAPMRAGVDSVNHAGVESNFDLDDHRHGSPRFVESARLAACAIHSPSVRLTAFFHDHAWQTLVVVRQGDGCDAVQCEQDC